MAEEDKETAPEQTGAATSNNPFQNPPWPRRSPGKPRGKNLGVKFFLLGVLALALCIPLFMVWG
ncbi:MAG: hypothetical protein KJP13_09425, partial [Altererythrobacter sp.]|nr:hypothetical protein [Altererythrobacter sp.]